MQVRPTECIEVESECGAAISIGVIYEPLGSSCTPQTGSNWGIIWQWNCGETVADRVKRCIERYWESMGGFRFSTRQLSLNSFYTCAAHGSYNYTRIVRGFALCLLARKLVRCIGGLGPTICGFYVFFSGFVFYIKCEQKVFHCYCLSDRKLIKVNVRLAPFKVKYFQRDISALLFNILGALRVNWHELLTNFQYIPPISALGV